MKHANRFLHAACSAGLAAVWAAGFALPLAGCGQGRVPAAPAIPDAVAGNAAEAVPEAGAGELACVFCRRDYIMMPRDVFADGLYCTESLHGPQADFLNLTYYDYASGQQLILCAAPGCPHNTEACTSYLPYGGMAFSAGNKLYVFRFQSKDYTLAALEQRELDGADAMVLADGLDASSIENVYFDGAALFITNGWGQPTLRVSLADGSVGEIPWPAGPNGSNWFALPAVWQGQMLVSTSVAVEGEYDPIYKLGMVAPQNGALTELHQWEPGGCNGTFYIKDGLCYYIATRTGMLMALDLATGEENQVSDAFCQYNTPKPLDWEDLQSTYYPATAWYGWFAGDWFCLKELWYDEDAGCAHGFACNIRTGEGKALGLTLFSNGYEQPVPVLGETSYGLLVKQEEASTTAHLTDSNGNPYTPELYYSVYALIDVDDYINGNPNYRTLEPLPHTELP